MICDHHTEQVEWCKLCIEDAEYEAEGRAEQLAALSKLYENVGNGVQKLLTGRWDNDA